MRLRPLLFLLCVLTFLSVAAVAQAPHAAGRTLIRAGHLLDVHTGKLSDAQTIVVSGDKIVSIAATSATPADSGDTVIDLSSLTVLPGLIDVHTHITSNPDFDPYKELANTDAKGAIDGVVNARTTLLAVFTTIRTWAPAATSTSTCATPSTPAKSQDPTCWSADRPSALLAAIAMKTCFPSPTTRSPTV